MNVCGGNTSIIGYRVVDGQAEFYYMNEVVHEANGRAIEAIIDTDGRRTYLNMGVRT